MTWLRNTVPRYIDEPRAVISMFFGELGAISITNRLRWPSLYFVSLLFSPNDNIMWDLKKCEPCITVANRQQGLQIDSIFILLL